MYASIPKNTYSTKYRSDDLKHFTGGYTVGKTDDDYDLPKSVYLTNGNSYQKTFSIRVDLPSKYIEIPLSISQLSEWFSKIGVEDVVKLQCDSTLLIPEQREVLNLLMNQCKSRLTEIEKAEWDAEKAEIEVEKNAAIDMGEYDIGQDECSWNERVDV